MINLVCALHCEAKPIISHYKLSKIPDAVFPIFENQQICLVVSGVGKVNTAAAMSYLFVKKQEKKNNPWLNFGIAGHKAAATGCWFNVNKVTDAVTGVRYYPMRYPLFNCSTVALKTMDKPQDTYEAEVLFDMEASAFMATALKFCSVELVQVMKIVSDNEHNHINCIDKKYVNTMIQNNLAPLIEVISFLQKKSEMFDEIYHLDDMFLYCLKKWHFTKYQKNELERLIQCWRSLGDKNAPDQLKACQNARQVIARFKLALNGAVMAF
ncbi:MAG TPA: hypothetical protein ENK06_02525 [Gammaproteobacteria bacterium]|nr:hypothetical protein [Gammaproteobacteria bacterium]